MSSHQGVHSVTSTSICTSTIIRAYTAPTKQNPALSQSRHSEKSILSGITKGSTKKITGRMSQNISIIQSKMGPRGFSPCLSPPTPGRSPSLPARSGPSTCNNTHAAASNRQSYHNWASFISPPPLDARKIQNKYYQSLVSSRETQAESAKGDLLKK